MQRINEFRKLKNPPITGCDALLIAQISLNHDIHRFIDACEVLIAELQDRIDKGISAYQNSGSSSLRTEFRNQRTVFRIKYISFPVSCQRATG